MKCISGSFFEDIGLHFRFRYKHPFYSLVLFQRFSHFASSISSPVKRRCRSGYLVSKVRRKKERTLSRFKKTGTASFDVTLQGFAPRNWAVTRESMRWMENKCVDVHVMLLRSSGSNGCHVMVDWPIGIALLFSQKNWSAQSCAPHAGS